MTEIVIFKTKKRIRTEFTRPVGRNKQMGCSLHFVSFRNRFNRYGGNACEEMQQVYDCTIKNG